MKIGDVMVKDVVSVDFKTPVIEACRIMGKKKIGCVIVTKEGKPYGVFTERDLLSRVLVEGEDLNEEVGKFCSAPLIVVTPDYDIKEAARIMSDMKIKRMIVVDEEGNIAGIMTASDFVKIMAECPAEI